MKTLHDAIKSRRSIRNYPRTELHETSLDWIEGELSPESQFFPEASVDAFLVRKGRRLQKDLSGIIAGYGKVEAPHYLVLTSESSENGYVELGYRYEFLVLKLTTRDIGTCWIGKGFRDEELVEYVDIPSRQSCVALIALGPLPEGERLAPIEDPKRKGLDHFLLNRVSDDLPDGTRKVIECLRRAPSALNGQPWRVIAKTDSIHLYLKARSKLTRLALKSLVEMNMVDSGIGLCHLEIGGRVFWDGPEVVRTNHPDPAGLKYIGSIVRNIDESRTLTTGQDI